MKTCYSPTNYSGHYIAPNTYTLRAARYRHMTDVRWQPNSFRREVLETASMVPMRLTVLTVQSHKALLCILVNYNMLRKF